MQDITWRSVQKKTKLVWVARARELVGLGLKIVEESEELGLFREEEIAILCEKKRKFLFPFTNHCGDPRSMLKGFITWKERLESEERNAK